MAFLLKFELSYIVKIILLKSKKPKNWTQNLELIISSQDSFLSTKMAFICEIKVLIYREITIFESWEAQKSDPKFGIDNLITGLFFFHEKWLFCFKSPPSSNSGVSSDLHLVHSSTQLFFLKGNSRWIIFNGTSNQVSLLIKWPVFSAWF